MVHKRGLWSRWTLCIVGAVIFPYLHSLVRMGKRDGVLAEQKDGMIWSLSVVGLNPTCSINYREVSSVSLLCSSALHDKFVKFSFGCCMKLYT